MPSEYSVEFVYCDAQQSARAVGRASILIGHVEAFVDVHDSTLRHFAGYCPARSWIADIVQPPEHVSGVVQVEGADMMQLGHSYTLEKRMPYQCYYDAGTRWLRFGKVSNEYDAVIGYFQDSIAGFVGGDAVTFWIQLSQTE